MSALCMISKNFHNFHNSRYFHDSSFLLFTFRVSHDGKGFFSSWELDHVTIIDHPSNDTVYHGNADTEVSKHFELHVPMFLQPKDNQNGMHFISIKKIVDVCF